jgi:hypothetical protein
MVKRAINALVSALLFVVLPTLSQAQNGAARPAATQDDSGFTSYAEFGGTSNADGQVYRLASSVGYNFNQYFGLDVGLPIYFVRPSSSTGGTASNGIGNPWVDLRVKFLNPMLNYGSMLTAFAPAGDSKRGLSTGHATFDWTNHFDHTFSRLTPFVEIGIANTVGDSRFFLRPYTTFGYNTHFQAGASFDLWKIFSVGGSAYDIVPTGQQTVFSKVVHGNGAGASHGRVFQQNQQTTGTADIARDDGFSAWVEASPSHAVSMQLGYTRSTHYALNSVSFNVGVNVGYLARRRTRH